VYVRSNPDHLRSPPDEIVCASSTPSTLTGTDRPMIVTRRWNRPDRRGSTIADVRAMRQYCANVFLRAFPGFPMNVARYFFGRHSLQILLYCGDNRSTRESPVEASRSALRSFLHYGSYHCNARNSIGAAAAAAPPRLGPTQIPRRYCCAGSAGIVGRMLSARAHASLGRSLQGPHRRVTTTAWTRSRGQGQLPFSQALAATAFGNAETPGT